MVLTVELDETTSMIGEVVVEGERLEDQSNNEYAIMSSRPFSPDETQRYAGSINDPGRMALSMPGVQFATQDNENTIVVKGNSPIGVQWRLEGIDIPNPNHFAQTNGSGGGISALSIFVLGNSDFITAAYPAEYGNSLGGIMDMRFRKGNNQNREYRFQAGLLGLDVAAEGPIGKGENAASYLVNYRYSTLGILSQMGVRVVSDDVDNVFQDLSFNFNIPLSKRTTVSLFGLGGLSEEKKIAKKDTANWSEGRHSQTYDFDTQLGLAGITLTHLIDEKSSLKFVGLYGGNEIQSITDTVTKEGDQAFRWENSQFKIDRLAANLAYQRKLKPGTSLKTGITFTSLNYSVFLSEYRCTLDEMLQLYSGSGTTGLLQPYLQYSTLLGGKVRLNAGLHSMYFGLTNSFVVEPRVSAEIYAGANTTVGVSYGLHSQILPFPTYHTTTSDVNGNLLGQPNRNLGFMRAHHAGFSVNQVFQGNIRLRIEPYLQYLFDVPAATTPESTYSLINENSSFEQEAMENIGEGLNYGAEVTFEKFFSNNIFFLLAGAIYDSRYRMNNGGASTWYNTRWNSNFNSSITAGKEWLLQRNRILEVGSRILYSGGARFTPIDSQRSEVECRAVYDDELAFTDRNINFFRMDLRLSFRKNNPGHTWKLSLDLQNLTNYQNPTRPGYDRWSNEVTFGFNTSIIPVISYTIDF